MKTISKQAVRGKAVSSVLASLRIERLTPSSYVVQGLHDCLKGQTSTAALLQEVTQRHVTVRRS